MSARMAPVHPFITSRVRTAARLFQPGFILLGLLLVVFGLPHLAGLRIWPDWPVTGTGVPRLPSVANGEFPVGDRPVRAFIVRALREGTNDIRFVFESGIVRNAILSAIALLLLMVVVLRERRLAR